MKSPLPYPCPRSRPSSSTHAVRHSRRRFWSSVSTTRPMAPSAGTLKGGSCLHIASDATALSRNMQGAASGCHRRQYRNFRGNLGLQFNKSPAQSGQFQALIPFNARAFGVGEPTNHVCARCQAFNHGPVAPYRHDQNHDSRGRGPRTLYDVRYASGKNSTQISKQATSGNYLSGRGLRCSICVPCLPLVARPTINRNARVHHLRRQSPSRRVVALF